MQPASSRFLENAELVPSPTAPQVGRITEVLEDGRAVVDFPGNPRGPLAARSTVSVTGPAPIAEGIPVLLLFEDGDLARPIIVGIVRDSLVTPASPPSKCVLTESIATAP